MKPLLYLTFSQMRNSIRRSLTSVRRLLALLLFAAYYYWIFVRMLVLERPRATDLPVAQQPVETAYAIGFAAALLVTLLFLATMGVPRSGFRPADVDMLFPTPVSPQTVVIFRIVRENFIALIYPLIFLLLGGAVLATLARSLFYGLENREALRWLPHCAALAWLLVQVAWVSASHAFSLWSADEPRSAWARKLPTVLLAASVAVLAFYIAFLVRMHGWSADAFLHAATRGALRYVFFPATAAVEIALAPLTGNWTAAFFSATGYLCAVVLFTALALRLAPAFYEQAALAVAASQPTETAMRTGDFLQYYADQARQGKLKARRLGFITRLRWTGAAAVVWKDLIISLRVSLTMHLLAVGGIVAFTAVMWFAGGTGHASGWARQGTGNLMLMLGLLTCGIFTWTSSRAGFIDLLKKVDANKALPFTLARSLFAQSLMRNLFGCFYGWLFCVAAVVLEPPIMPIAVGLAIALLPGCYILSSSVLLHLLFFPDVEDYSQRMLRELLSTATALLGLAPGAGAALGVLLLFRGEVLLASVIATFVNVVVGAGLLVAAAEVYTGFNPAE